MDENSAVGIGHYGAVLKRQWKIVAVVTVLALLAAAAYLFVTKTTATATTVVNLSVITTDPFNPGKSNSALLDSATEKQVATSYAVATAAAQTLHTGDGVNELRKGLSVAALATGTTMSLDYTSTTVEKARSGADALATAYLAYRQAQAESRKTKLQAQLQEQMVTLQASLGNAKGAADSSVLTQIGSVQSQLNQLALVDTSGGSILNPATENAVVLSPNPPLVMVTGLLAGLVLGLVLAFLVNILDRRVRDWYDVRGAGAGPLLASLLATRPTLPATGNDLDQFRVLRERLLASSRHHLGVLTVIDETRRPQGSDVAANLAVALAETGAPVQMILMQAQEEQIALLSESLALQSVPGTSDGLQFSSAKNLSLTVFQPDQDKSSFAVDEFVTESVRHRLATKGSGDIIILAVPPSAPHASRLAAARLSDSVLLVGEMFRTKIDVLALNAAEIKHVAAHLTGTVLVSTGRREITVGNGAKTAKLAVADVRPDPSDLTVHRRIVRSKRPVAAQRIIEQ
ncbi:MAG: CpsD/CapB family tyrosine-protein kinase [Acidobacteria bacterium]|nr:CpsD/CapB family tyrosine-protein kinase [Acidobacteriota bacterium]